MTKKTFIIFLLLITVFLGSCKNNNKNEQSKSKPVMERINEYPELKKALQYYSSPKDSLKKRAMLFLIKNLDAKTRLTTMADQDIVSLYRKMAI